MTILVTGATGFVGRAVVAVLAADGHEVRGVSRATAPALEDPGADWRVLLHGVDVVVHLAAMVHVMGDTTSLAGRFAAVNEAGTLRLAEQAAGSGVRRFVYMSTIKVHGDSGHVTEESPMSAVDPYGRSKAAAETGLVTRLAATRMDVVRIRPPLVYGPGGRANFGALARLVRSGVPLPVGCVENKRSLVGLDNLAAFVATCVHHPRAAGEAFLVSDGMDLSTPALVRAMATAMGRSPRLIPVPIPMLRVVASLTGRGQAFDRLTGSLTLDTRKAARTLDWRPPFSVDHQMRRALCR